MNSIKHKTARKITSVLLSATTMVWLAGASALLPTVASADAATDALIAQLQAQIAALSAQLAALSASSSTSAGCSFTRDLTLGSKGDDVTCLQNYLKSKGFFTYAGGATGYFGSITQSAVAAWQSSNAITPAAGYFGPKSRAAYSAMVSITPPAPPSVPSGPTPVVPAGTGLSVMAGTQPANSLAPQSAALLPFTRIVLSASADGDVTVTGITVQRTGLAQDAVFSGVVLLDENGVQVGNSKTFNSNHQAVIGDTFIVPKGTSKTYTVAGNMAASLASYAGQVAYLTVNGVNSAATVSGLLPVTGAGHTINASLTIGSASLFTSTFDPDSASTQNIGTTGFKFMGLKITAGSGEDLRLTTVRLNQTGSAGSSDLGNVVVVADGVSYPTTLSTDGKYYTASFGSGIVLTKGNSLEVYIQGDIVGSNSAGRTVQFDLYKATDIYAKGENYGYGVTPTAGESTAAATTASEFTTGSPFFSGSTITVAAGTVTTVQKAVSVAAQNIAVNVSNQVLGGYETDIKGEPISVASQVFHFATSTAVIGASMITNISLYDANGAVVAGPVDAVADGVSGQKVTFTDTVTYPVGKRVYTLKGKIPTTAANGAIITTSTDIDTDWTTVTGQTTGNTISLGTTASFNMNAVTVKAAALAISISASPAVQNVVAGSQGKVYANYQFDATGSGEDVRFSSFTATLTGTTGNVTGCQLWDGSKALNTGSNVVNPDAATEVFTFDQQLTVTKGTIKTLALACNVGSSASGANAFGITTSSTNPTVTGVTSGTSVTATGGTLVGQALTATSGGSLAVSADSSAPSYTVVASGSTGVTVGVLKFRATNEPVNLNRVGLKLTSVASSSPSDVVQVTLWDGITQVGSAIFAGSSMFSTSTLSSTVVLPKDADKTLIVKADLAQIGTSQPGTQGHLIIVDVDTASTNTQGTGADSGATINATGSTEFSGVRVFKTYPTLAVDTSLPSTGVSDGRLMRFKVTANSNGPVGIYQFKLNVASTSSATTGTTVTGVNVYAFSDSSYSQAISGTGVSSGGQISSSNQSVGGTGTVTITTQGTQGIQIPAGSTYYFEVRATVSGTGTTYSVITTLSGDSGYPAIPSTNTADTRFMLNTATTSPLNFLGTSNFVWSPNATGTSVLLSNDWTNGYALPGFPSNGLIVTRTN